jgi:hypothetical protein
MIRANYTLDNGKEYIMLTYFTLFIIFEITLFLNIITIGTKQLMKEKDIAYLWVIKT